MLPLKLRAWWLWRSFDMNEKNEKTMLLWDTTLGHEGQSALRSGGAGGQGETNFPHPFSSGNKPVRPFRHGNFEPGPLSESTGLLYCDTGNGEDLPCEI